MENATALIWKTMLIGEKRFRRLNAPELLADVYAGARYVDGVRVKPEAEDSTKQEEVAA